MFDGPKTLTSCMLFINRTLGVVFFTVLEDNGFVKLKSWATVDDVHRPTVNGVLVRPCAAEPLTRLHVTYVTSVLLCRTPQLLLRPLSQPLRRQSRGQTFSHWVNVHTLHCDCFYERKSGVWLFIIRIKVNLKLNVPLLDPNLWHFVLCIFFGLAIHCI